MSNSVWPHRRQPTRLPHPWDSPGKNTGVGCHFLLQCMKVTSQSEVAQSCPTLSNPMDCGLPGSSVHGIFQAGVLEWGAIACSDSKGKKKFLKEEVNCALWWEFTITPLYMICLFVKSFSLHINTQLQKISHPSFREKNLSLWSPPLLLWLIH